MSHKYSHKRKQTATTPYVWCKIPVKGNHGARFDHTLIPGDDDNLWVFAGVTQVWNPKNDLWKINLGKYFLALLTAIKVTGEAEEIIVDSSCDKPPVVKDHTAVLHPSGEMFVFGGKSNNQAMNSLWILDTGNFLFVVVLTAFCSCKKMDSTSCR